MFWKRKELPWKDFSCAKCVAWDRISDNKGVCSMDPPRGFSARIDNTIPDARPLEQLIAGQVQPTANVRCVAGWRFTKEVGS